MKRIGGCVFSFLWYNIYKVIIMELKHYSVLLNESIEMLNIKPNGIYVDCTLGGGGHSSEILKRLNTGHLYAFDQDEDAIKLARPRLEALNKPFTIIKSNFVNLKEELNNLGITKVDGIIFDLGVSSFQFDLPERGFSYRFDAPLDMRMDQSVDFSAYDIVNNYSLNDLTKIFYEYGEEKFSRQIAKKIVDKRTVKHIETTFELVDIIKSALPAAVLRKSGHPAKQVFQALRIEVNHELDYLKTVLNDALELLNIDGVLAVITFHSLEDRIVKLAFKDKTTLKLPKGIPFIPEGYKVNYELINKNVIIPSSVELEENNRSHSAKLRGIRRI